MIKKISHNRDDESMEAKARWFQSMSLEERMEYFCNFMDFLIETNPKILEQKSAQSIPGRVQVITKA